MLTNFVIASRLSIGQWRSLVAMNILSAFSIVSLICGIGVWIRSYQAQGPVVAASQLSLLSETIERCERDLAELREIKREFNGAIVSRRGPYHLLSTIGQGLSDSAWLSSIRADTSTLEIYGRAMNQQDLNSTLQEFGSHDPLRSIRLISSREGSGDESGTILFHAVAPARIEVGDSKLEVD